MRPAEESGGDERLGGGGLHWMIAWRHLRVGDEIPSFVTPLFLVALYLLLVGAGFVAMASLSPGEVTAAPPLFPELAAGAAAPAPTITAYAGLIGGLTLFSGAMLLLGAILSRIFTLLATVIILSVMLGCMALVVVLSLMTGLEHELRDKILGQLSHVRVARDDNRPFSDYQELLPRLREVPGIVGASPYLKGEVMVRNGLNRQGGILTGIIPELQAEVSYLPEILTEGRYEYLTHPDRIPEASFSFEVHRDDPPPARRDRGGIGDDTDEGGVLGLGALAPKLGEAGFLPRTIDLPAPVFAGDPQAAAAEGWDDGWEDPAIELPKLGLAPSSTPAPEEDVARDRKGAGEGGAALRIVEQRARLARPGARSRDDGEDEGWEDPEVEVPKLREAGILPPAPTSGLGSSEGTDGAGDDENDGRKTASADDPGVAGEAVLAPVLLGSEKARELIAHAGDRVQLITPIGRQTPVGRMPGRMDVRVAGVFNADHYEYDRWLLYAPLATVQSLLRTGDRISGIELRVDDLDRIREHKRTVEGLLAELGRDDLVVRDWQELNASLFSAMALEKIAVFIALLCVILVASFGILGSNLMSVLEKSKEIAILKTMGTSDALIQRVFIAEGLCLGVLGGLIGIATGIALCVVLDHVGLPLSGDLGDLETLPVAIDPLEILVVGLSALAIVWLSSLYPARVASRMRPVEALRKAEA